MKRQAPRALRIPPAEWKSPEGLYSNAGAPLLSTELQTLASQRHGARLLEFWQDHLNFAHDLIRRGLEVAIWQADKAEHDAPTPIIEDWELGAERAAKAHASLQTYVRHLLGAKNPRRAEYLWRPLLTSKAFSTAGGVTQLHREVRLAALNLLRAKEYLDKLANAAAGQARTMKAGRQNEGDIPFKEFSIVLGELWLCLTGRVPANGAHVNPFLRFLMAGWVGAGGGWCKAPGEQAEADLETAPEMLFVSGANAAAVALVSALPPPVLPRWGPTWWPADWMSRPNRPGPK